MTAIVHPFIARCYAVMEDESIGDGSCSHNNNNNRLQYDSRDDLDTKDSFMSYTHDSMDNDTSTSMSLGGFSMASLGRIPNNDNKGPPPKGKRQKGGPQSQSIHHTLSHGLNMNDDDVGNLKLLEVSSTLSKGEMILKNLSINLIYSAKFANLCCSSPTSIYNNNNNAHGTTNGSRPSAGSAVKTDRNEGIIPKKHNTSCKETKDIAAMVTLVF